MEQQESLRPMPTIILAVKIFQLMRFLCTSSKPQKVSHLYVSGTFLCQLVPEYLTKCFLLFHIMHALPEREQRRSNQLWRVYEGCVYGMSQPKTIGEAWYLLMWRMCHPEECWCQQQCCSSNFYSSTWFWRLDSEVCWHPAPCVIVIVKWALHGPELQL